MNQAASHLVNRRLLCGVVRSRKFHRQGEGGKRRLKSGLWQARSPSLRGRLGFYQADGLPKVDIPDWFKMSFMEEADITVRLSIKSLWGLAEETPFWACCFLLSVNPLSFANHVWMFDKHSVSLWGKTTSLVASIYHQQQEELLHRADTP